MIMINPAGAGGDAPLRRDVLGVDRDTAFDLTQFRVSRFDVVTSFLTALMLLLAAGVLMLFLVWLIDSMPEADPPMSPPLRLVSTYHPVGVELDFLEPGEKEVEAISEPAVEETLVALTDAVSRVAGSVLVAEDGVEKIRGGERGAGDYREPGPIVADGVPAYERWQLNFEARDLESYARQLDFYDVELAAIGGGIPGVDYARSLASDPQVRRGESDSERRLYFLWDQPGPLARYDQRLLTRAGVELDGRQVIKFIPHELEIGLTRLELEYARARGRSEVSEIARTVFLSERQVDGYRFRVIGQRYRKPGA